MQIDDTHFKILGVDRYANKDEIKKAYREEIKKWHPDKFPHQPDKIQEAVEKSKKINEAFSFLENYQPPLKPHKGSTTSNRTKASSSDKYQTSNAKGFRLNIERIRVESSNLCSVGYDADNKILQVEFLNGSFYQYYNVSQDVYNQLMNAASKGKYFNSKIAFAYKHEDV